MEQSGGRVPDPGHAATGYSGIFFLSHSASFSLGKPHLLSHSILSCCH